MVAWGVISVNKLLHHLCFFLVEQVMSGNWRISFSHHPLPCYRKSCPSLNKCKSFLKLGVSFFVFGFVCWFFLYVKIYMLIHIGDFYAELQNLRRRTAWCLTKGQLEILSLTQTNIITDHSRVSSPIFLSLEVGHSNIHTPYGNAS